MVKSQDSKCYTPETEMCMLCKHTFGFFYLYIHDMHMLNFSFNSQK